MANTKFPDATALTDCPIQGCTGKVHVELKLTASQRTEHNTMSVHVEPSGFKLVGEHNHEDPWMEVEGGDDHPLRT